MNRMLTCDLHIHTKYSCDSDVRLEDYCRAAVANGVDVLCFTDHVDCNPHDDGYEYYDAEKYFEDFRKTKAQYGDRLTVLSGIEFADPHLYQDALAEYSALPYDFILGTVHFWYRNLYPGEMMALGVTSEENYGYYWDTVLAAVKAGGFDSFGHMDFPKRFYKDLYFDPVTIEKICGELVRKNISLEINTSSLRKNLTVTMPDKELLSIYKDCGGRYVTLGSDAHRVGELASGFLYAKELVRYFGFEEVVYRGRVMSAV